MDPKFVPQNTLKKKYDSEVYSLDVKPRLLKKQTKSSLWYTFNIFRVKNLKKSKVTDEETTQVTTLRVVPLPDFTVYPTNMTDRTHNNWMIPLKLVKIFFWPRGYLIRNDDQRSPFLKLIRTNENEFLYDNPAMEACINFKWSAAKNHFIRHFLLFIVFSLAFAFSTGIIYNSKISSSSSLQLSFGVIIFLILDQLFFQ